MSRHRIVKNLDLDEELDDYDGEDDYYEGGNEGVEELSEEDQELMASGTTAVREALGAGGKGISDKEIRDTLWHYYYDVGKSVSYLISTHAAKETNKPKKSKETPKNIKNGGFHFLDALAATGDGMDSKFETGRSSRSLQHDFDQAAIWKTPAVCTGPLSFKEFFKDMPWLNTRLERHTIFVEPLYPGGLLGGSSDGAPKMSKLQALAAARKKRAEEQKAAGQQSNLAQEAEKSIAQLSVSSQRMATSSRTSLKPPPSQRTDSQPQSALSKLRSSRQRPEKLPEVKVPPPVSKPLPVEKPEEPENATPYSVLEVATPSEFARTMFGADDTTRQPPGSLFVLPYNTHVPTQSTDAFAEPSPDDVVIAAQSKAKNLGAKGSAAKTVATKKAADAASGLEGLRIDDTPKATSKNLDVLSEYEKAKKKKAANFVVIGHVDAGKSTLMGRLLFDLSVVDQRTIEKYRREAERMGKSSFALAWVLDQGAEERSRGVTIDIATNKFETEQTAFTILDAPGHRDFIPNMIAGASQADFAVLVIDASTGSFESGLKGQTKEHALLVRSMGVQRVIVAVNKLDTVGWSKERYDEIAQQISSFLITAGFQSKNLSFVPLSGLHGDFVARRGQDPAAAWYSGPTLVEELDNSEPVSRALEKPLRLTIGDIFRGGVQHPLSISGRLESGSMQVGDMLLAQPSGETCYVKGLEVDGQPADWTVAGQNATVHLSGIDPSRLVVGDVLCPPSHPISCVKTLTAKVLAFEFLLPMQVDVHRGRLHVAGSISRIVATLDKGSGAVVKKKPKIVKPGGIARVVVELDAEVPLEAPARVVLRSNGETVAAGLIE